MARCSAVYAAGIHTPARGQDRWWRSHPAAGPSHRGAGIGVSIVTASADVHPSDTTGPRSSGQIPDPRRPRGHSRCERAGRAALSYALLAAGLSGCSASCFFEHQRPWKPAGTRWGSSTLASGVLDIVLASYTCARQRVWPLQWPPVRPFCGNGHA